MGFETTMLKISASEEDNLTLNDFDNDKIQIKTVKICPCYWTATLGRLIIMKQNMGDEVWMGNIG